MLTSIALLAIPALGAISQIECKLRAVPEGVFQTVLLNSQDACDELTKISTEYFELFKDDPLEQRIEAQAIYADAMQENMANHEHRVAAQEKIVIRQKNRAKRAQQKLVVAKNRLLHKDKMRRQ
jgi:hypothetical protein